MKQKAEIILIHVHTKLNKFSIQALKVITKF